MNDTEQPWWQDNIGSGHGVMQSGNAPWPGPMMTQVFVTIKKKCCKMIQRDARI